MALMVSKDSQKLSWTKGSLIYFLLLLLDCKRLRTATVVHLLFPCKLPGIVSEAVN